MSFTSRCWNYVRENDRRRSGVSLIFSLGRLNPDLSLRRPNLSLGRLIPYLI